ncbi:hypothetical protein BBK14_33415 [Parafrankia soli]|uniref:Uncharacterized protein n=1 Tax=Parafrankia soli TaxID=2599596 RepID=A0A1S1QN33_9ACTN|nr:hypothetical protein [Parafrankia soli]OHV35390.1 hypothetical protein BBK14_33415 [Parafrankia soli]
MSDRWDETHEPPGWGEHANGRLLDDVLDGRDALIGYARTVELIRMPTTADLLGLLDEAIAELVYVDSDDRCREIEDAAGAIRKQLTATTPAIPVAA